MKTVQVSTYDINGGAAKAAYRLHRALSGQGLSSMMYVLRQSGDDPEIVSFKSKRTTITRLGSRFRRWMIRRSFAPYKISRPEGYEHFSDDRTIYGIHPLSQLPQADVINLHWISEFVDYQAIFSRLPQDILIVWTLHDMNPFTGGCHYDHGCGKYIEGCESCPQLGSDDPKDLSHDVWYRKFNALQTISPDRLHIVALNLWMATEVKRSKLLGRYPVTIIPNSLDTDIFSPRDTGFTRTVLDIPYDARVVLFVTSKANNKRKGFNLLAEALTHLGDIPNLFLLSVGPGISSLKIDAPHRQVGVVSNERFLSLVYSAADLLVVPSLQDNLPNTILESFACGTPAVGFDVGGIPDLIRPDITGLLSPAENTVDLAATIRELLENESQRVRMAENCRRIALEEFTSLVQANRYFELYQSQILKNRSHSK